MDAVCGIVNIRWWIINRWPMNFADGATATLNMIGGTAKPERNIHIIGTKGEIKGVFDDSVFHCAHHRYRQ